MSSRAGREGVKPLRFFVKFNLLQLEKGKEQACTHPTSSRSSFTKVPGGCFKNWLAQRWAGAPRTNTEAEDIPP